MTNLVEPRRAADEENVDHDAAMGAFGDGELTTLVRRWMAAGTKVQERVRRESRENLVRPAPEPEATSTAEADAEASTEADVESAVEASADVEAAVEAAVEADVEPDVERADAGTDSEVEATGPVEGGGPVARPVTVVSRREIEAAAADRAEARARADGDAPAPAASDASDAEGPSEADLEVAPEVVVEARSDVPAAPAEEPELLGAPPLPHRPTVSDVEQATRVAVLIDARRVPEGVATALLARLAERGAVNVCRAYADWTRADLGDWVARMRLQGLHSFHQFSDDDDQALVALAIDAVDIARDAAVDEVVVAGDTTSLLPLVHRLHAAGVRVIVVGPDHTSHDVRAACDEFWDAGSIEADEPAPTGRHRA